VTATISSWEEHPLYVVEDLAKSIEKLFHGPEDVTNETAWFAFTRVPTLGYPTSLKEPYWALPHECSFIYLKT
jgi:hypothetical protein